MENRTKNIIAGAIIAALSVVAFWGCNGKATAIEQYNSYKITADKEIADKQAMIESQSSTIDRQQSKLAADSLALNAYHSDVQQISKLADQISAITLKHSGN